MPHNNHTRTQDLTSTPPHSATTHTQQDMTPHFKKTPWWSPYYHASDPFHNLNTSNPFLFPFVGTIYSRVAKRLNTDFDLFMTCLALKLHYYSRAGYVYYTMMMTGFPISNVPRFPLNHIRHFVLDRLLIENSQTTYMKQAVSNHMHIKTSGSAHPQLLVLPL